MAPRLEEQDRANTANGTSYQFVGCGEISSDAAVLAVTAASVTTGAPETKRPSSSPVTTRAGNGSEAQARDSPVIGSGSDGALPTTTRFPRRRPLSTLPSAIMHVCPYAERTVATADRAGSSGGPAATFLAYTPPGRSARAVAAANSAVVSRGGVTAPANTSAMTRS